MDFNISDQLDDYDIAFEIAWLINSNFKSWLFPVLARASRTEPIVMRKLAAQSVFLSMSPSYAKLVRELKKTADDDRERGVKHPVAYSIPVPPEAEEMVVKMIMTWTLETPSGEYGVGRKPKQISILESGPEMVCETLKTALCSEFDIDVGNPDSNGLLAGKLEARLRAGCPFYFLIKDEDNFASSITKDPALGCLFLLIKSQGEKLAGGQSDEDLRFVSFLEEVMDLVFNESEDPS